MWKLIELPPLSPRERAECERDVTLFCGSQYIEKSRMEFWYSNDTPLHEWPNLPGETEQRRFTSSARSEICIEKIFLLNSFSFVRSGIDFLFAMLLLTEL